MMPQPNVVNGLSESARSISPSSKKRSRDDDEVLLSPEALAHMSRSERKRHRERKRRSDVNKGFDDLMEVLVEIDPVVKAEANDRARRGTVSDEHLLSRVELIGRTVEVLGRVHKENEERKMIIQQLLQKSVRAAPAGHGFLNKPQRINPPLQGSLPSLGQHFPGFAMHNPTSTLSAGGAPFFHQRLGGASGGATLPPDFQMLADVQVISNPFTSYAPNNLRLAVDDALRKYKETQR
mmetsp:Transcript_5681/g.11032  ORF Transcript_5681/g.11032 Transcript_5681/m.11032 type:complete len:237 (-) Transcript_5681:93-803(-)